MDTRYPRSDLRHRFLFPRNEPSINSTQTPNDTRPTVNTLNACSVVARRPRPGSGVLDKEAEGDETEKEERQQGVFKSEMNTWKREEEAEERHKSQL